MSLTQETLFSILNIILIDIVLGGDNAVVIALACRRLPEKRRNKAIILGTGLAVVLRICLTGIMVVLLKIPLLLLLGGLLLVVIAYRLIANQNEDMHVQAGTTLFSAVRTIVIADLVMGLDNILGIAGASDGHIELVVLGLCFSVPIIIWGSKIILIAMEYVPGLIYIGGAILAYTAANMIVSEPKLTPWVNDHPNIKPITMAIIITSVLISGWLKNRLNHHSSQHLS
ncbi:TerC family protein [Pullulanibacillus sp. KACC 23026]|uniref:TerC family protein n=1 Tax=Pullulanibacillus sp. KACC 23026 TaxID=3028315 RepID=UPI0023B090D6|nr:TerC family protein [Pullulanibacillus sp. KACC 23026]WEG11919.1 TerC family protein [Pullulanibacillus sp. KACC 23026]